MQPAAERILCALIIAIIPFAISFGLSIGFRQSALYAAIQGVGAFVIVAVVGTLIVTFGNDEALGKRPAWLAEQIPLAVLSERRASQFAYERNQAALDREADREDRILRRESVRKCPYCAELIQAEALKCKHCCSATAVSSL